MLGKKRGEFQKLLLDLCSYFPECLLIHEPPSKSLHMPGLYQDTPVSRGRYHWRWAPAIVEALDLVKDHAGREKLVLALTARRQKVYQTVGAGLAERAVPISQAFIVRCCGKQPDSDTFPINLRDQDFKRMESDSRLALQIWNTMSWIMGGIGKQVQELELSSARTTKLQLFMKSLAECGSDLSKQLLVCLAGIVNHRKDAAVKRLLSSFTDAHKKTMKSSPLSSPLLFDMSFLEPVLEELSKTAQEKTQDAIVKIASRPPVVRQGGQQKRIPKKKPEARQSRDAPVRSGLAPRRGSSRGASSSSSRGGRRVERPPIKSGRKTPGKKSRSSFFQK